MDLRIGQVSVPCPRLNVQIIPRSDVVPMSAELLVRRVGDSSDFASYAPIQLVGNILSFQLDDLVFDTKYGRFAGTLSYMGNKYASLQFEYTANPAINLALQLSTIGPYKQPREFCNEDWSGSGIAGPGTLIGLKDALNKSYNGCGGFDVRVSDDEKGFQFLPHQEISGNGIQSIGAGSGIAVDSTDPENPVVSATGSGSGQVNAVVAGVNIVVDNSDPANPVIAGILQVLDGNNMPAAPVQNGILAMYLGKNPSGSSVNAGVVFSFDSQWIDFYTNDVYVITP